MTVDARVDAYIAKAQPFAQPILTHLRALVHQAAPDLEEAIKWGFPAFCWQGKMVVGIAAFKAHVALNFWHGELVTGGTGKERDAMGSMGRITALADLPDDAALTAMVAQASALARSGVTPPHAANRKPRPELPVPALLTEALAAHPAASVVWDGFSPSSRRDYCEWIGEAKRPETAAKRTAEAIEWIAAGRKRHWKYENC